ncbi:MAG: hypothetical protein IJS46_02700, partial [Kiritimatiellae bacterium]|nr:hypothetical protein [Kiritimatiellia bacterium]
MTPRKNDAGRESAYSGDRISSVEAVSLNASFRSFQALLPHLVAAATLSILAFALYLATMPQQAVPGQPAETLERLAGLRPNIQPRFFVWRHLTGVLLGVFPFGLSRSSGLAFGIFSALGVGAIYLALSQMILALFDRETWAMRLKRNSIGVATAVSMIGGSAAAVALATSAPYWTTATQAYPYAFHLAWFLFCIFLLFRFTIAKNGLTLFLFCLLYAAGLAQTSVFLAHFPLVAVIVALGLWTGNKPPVGKFAGVLALIAAVFAAVLAANALEYCAYGGVGEEHAKFFVVAQNLARAITGGIMGSIPRAWWLILLGLTVLPWLACLVVARRGVNGERGPAMAGLHAAGAITTLCVLLDLRFSPWQFYNVESLQIVPYAMTALSFGYLAAHLAALALTGLGDEEKSYRRRAVCRAWAAAASVPICLAVALWRNADDADSRTNSAVFRYVDACIDGAQGRPWIVTPGMLDANIRLRAAERGVELHPINISGSQGRRGMEELSALLPDVALKNAANIGSVALLREWVTRRAEADKELAMSVMPDFWHLGPYDDMPNGVVFIGRPRESDGEADLDAAVEKAYAVLSEMDEALAFVGDDATARSRFYAAFVRQRASQAANNVAYLLERAKRADEAWDLYAKVAQFDPNNISCLLNRAALFRKGLHPEAAHEIEDALNELQAKLAASKIDVRGSLSSSFGYVSSPSAFLDLGWRWAMSGMSTLAINSLNRAMESATVENHGRIRSLIADVYRQSGDLESSEAAYMAVLREDPGVMDALVGLARLCVMRGDFEAARKHMEQARVAGIPQDRLLFEVAAMNLAAGDIDSAVAAAQRLMDFNPDS